MTIQWTEFTLILQPSPLGGIGVFATHDIPSGMQIFLGTFKRRKMSISDIPHPFLKYVIYLSDTECLCPAQFDRMEINWYLNHSSQPNIIKKENGKVYAMREIKKGEEILFDYNHFNEPEQMKEDYYKHTS